MCIFQLDVKKIIAYSSVSHISLVLHSFEIELMSGKIGGIFLIINHRYISSGIFFGVGLLYYRFFVRNYIFFNGLMIEINIFKI